MNKAIEKQSKIGEIFEEISSYKNTVKLRPDYLFRGQVDKNWTLEPSLTRILSQKELNREKALQLEREIVNKFALSAKGMLPYKDWKNLIIGKNFDFMGWFVIMQHYSAPTRKLDWTISPLVGLYFACIGNFDSDGRLWIADFNKVSQRKESSDPKFVDNCFRVNGLNNLVFTTALNPHERIEAQQGMFSVSTNPLADHKDVLEGYEALKSIVIPGKVKFVILEELYNMNVNSRTLFPGIDGLGKSINEYCQLWDENSIIE